MSRSSSIPIVLAPPPTHRVPAADNRQSSHQSNRDSHVTLAPSVYDPGAAARRDKRLPPVPRSPWPLARAPESSTDEDASPPATSGSNTTSSTTRGRNEHRDTLRPPPVPKIFPQHVDGVAHQPRTARSTPALRTGRAPSLTSHPPLHRPTHSNPPPRTNTVRDLTPAEKRSASNPPPLRKGPSFDLVRSDTPGPPYQPPHPHPQQPEMPVLSLFPHDSQPYPLRPPSRKSGPGESIPLERQNFSAPLTLPVSRHSAAALRPLPLRLGQSYPGPHVAVSHSHSSSEVSVMTGDSVASYATAGTTSRKPLTSSSNNNNSNNNNSNNSSREVSALSTTQPRRQNTSDLITITHDDVEADTKREYQPSPPRPSPPQQPLPRRPVPQRTAPPFFPPGGKPIQSQYMSMLHTLENIPRLHNILVSCFAWILLAGFVIVPGSFTSLRRLQADSIVDENGQDIPAGPVGGHNALRYTTTNTWVTVVGFLCMGVGALGALWLGLRWRKNYVWLINKLYLPLMLNALAGGISTLVNVYTQQYSAWRVQARVAFAVEAFVFLLSGILFAIYNFWLLEKVKADHANGRFPGSSSSATAGVKGKSRVKKFSFLARFDSLRRRPPVAPGSVV